MTNSAAKRGFFITGTDTGVGKTLVTVALTRAFVARGMRTAVMKPVAAGIVTTPEGPRNEDALELLGQSNVSAPYEDVNPWLLTTPASPHLAARHDGVWITHERILAAHQRLAARADLVLVEGAGGWLAPISSVATMADIAEKLALPVIFVVGLRLGCLNHALLTREAIRSSGLPFAGWVANKMAAEMPLANANIETAFEPLWSGSARRRARRGSSLLPDPRANEECPHFPIPAWADEAANKLVSA